MSIADKIQKVIFSGVISLFISFSMFSPAYAALDRARQAGFVPHKAIYDIRLKSKKSSAKVSNIHGKMMYEWKSSCDAWVSSHQFDMTYDYIEAPSVRVTSDFSNYESFDGKRFNFTSTRKTGDTVLGEVRGAVDGDIINNGGKAIYTKPENKEYDIPKGALFPMAHTLGVLKEIKDGKKFYKATLFDGSDEDGPVEVNSFIGKEATYIVPDEFAKDINKELVETKSWNIRLAFFPLNEYSVTSDYEMSLVFHENGVISGITIDYDEFSVEQKLIAIKSVENECDSKNSSPDKKGL